MRLRKPLPISSSMTNAPNTNATARKHAIPLLTLVFILLLILSYHYYLPILSSPFISSIYSRIATSIVINGDNRPINSSHIPAYLVSTSYGGLGNQLYFLCEALALAHAANLTLIPPPVVARGRSRDAPFSKYFRMDVLRKIVSVAERMPSSCSQKLSNVYLVRRRGNEPSINAPLTSRAAVAACHAAGFEGNYLACGAAVSEVAKKRVRFLPLTRDPRVASLFSTEIRDNTKHGHCVMVDGHSYQRAGLVADEYLYSFLRFVEPVQRIREFAERLEPNTLIVVHLRWDEKECVRWPEEGKVCLRVNRAVGRADTVGWVSVDDFVNMITERMHTDGIERVYLAVSPYADEAVVENIRNKLAKAVTLLPQIEVQGSDDHEVNMVERELAIRAKVFIADYMSTWSSTVYYKRRTLNKDSEFSKVILGNNPDLGFLGKTGILREPQWFEHNGYLDNPVALASDAM